MSFSSVLEISFFPLHTRVLLFLVGRQANLGRNSKQGINRYCWSIRIADVLVLFWFGFYYIVLFSCVLCVCLYIIVGDIKFYH